MTDFLGNDLQIDDLVAFSTLGSASLWLGRITKLTPKTATAEFLEKDGTSGLGTHQCQSHQIVKLK